MKFTHWIGAGVLGLAAFFAISIRLNRARHDSPATVLGIVDSGNRPATRQVKQRNPPANRLPTQSEVPQELATLGTALTAVKTRGDYGLLKRVLMGMKPNERHLFLWADLEELKSPLGTGHDYRESLAIIKELGGNSTASLISGLARRTGLRLDPAKDKDFVTSLDFDAWKTMIAGAVEVNAPKAFELTLAGWDETHQRIACAEATRIWLEKDSMAACGRIMKMPSGELKDAAVTEMVNWLVEKNSEDQASAWISEISDPSLRDETKKRLMNRR